jgi:hypothetical protein
VQIKKSLLCSAAQSTSFSSSAAAASQLTSSMIPHVSLLCRWRKPTVESCVDNTAKLRPQASVLALQGGLVPNKISGVGTNIGLLVHVLPGPNKQRGRQKSMLLS